MSSATDDNLPQLPPEVLAHVFEFLPVNELRKLRHTCSHWDAIIRETPALMKKFTLVFNQSLLQRASRSGPALDRLLRMKHLGGACFVGVTTAPSPAIDPFWDQLGGTLQVLRFKECSLSVQNILRVLRLTPNLRSFSLKQDSEDSLAYYTPTWATFSLARLEKLDLHLRDDRFLNLFGQLAPNLKVLKFNGKWKVGDQLIQTLVPLVKTRKDTLKKLTLQLVQTSPQLLREIGQIEGLRLTAISLKNWELLDEDTIRQFIRQQPYLERFKCVAEFYLQSGILDLLADCLPKLRCVRINARFMCGELPRFLDRASNLEHLALNSGDRKDALTVDLNSNSSPNLRKLFLTGYHISKDKLATFFQRSNNIKHLTLESCRQPSIVELIATIGELRSLEHLKIMDLKAKKGILATKNISSIQWPHLTTLYLRSCELVIGTIANLVQRSPNLEEVTAENVARLQNDDVLAICAQLPRLRALKLIHPRNDLSETSLEYLKHYCGKLSRLEFSINGKAITEQHLDREFKAALPGVKIDMVPRMPGRDGLDWYDNFEEYDY